MTNYVDLDLVNRVKNTDIYKSYDTLIKIFRDIVNSHVIIGLNTIKENIYLYDSEHDMFRYDIGKITTTSMAYKCMQTGKPIINEINRNNMARPYRSVATPIFEGNTLIGCAVMSCYLDHEFLIMESSKNIQKQSQEIENLICGYYKSFSEIRDAVESVQSLATAQVTETKNIQNVTNVIKSVADKSNMLGLNASIEAARAGEFGRGFNVVAREIREMSETSKTNVKKIEEDIRNIIGNSKSILESVNKSTEKYDTQVGYLENINLCVESLRHLADDLSKLSDI